MLTASKGASMTSRPIMRLTQPRRSDEPGSASSISSMAAKWERFGRAIPTAWTAASSPDRHSHSSGAICGCSPNMSSAQISDARGRATPGRAT
jgi:hypothetical protein